jgi:phytoene synthase
MPGSADDYCEAIVRAHDEDRWLSLRYAPAAARGALSAIYALHLELQRIPRLVREPAIGAIRLKWWSDSVGEMAQGAAPREQPVLEALGQAGLSASTFAGIEAAIEARARLLEAPQFAATGSFTRWCAMTEIWIAEAALRTLAPAPDAKIAGVDHAATAYALARLHPLLAPHLASEIRIEALGLHDAARKALRRFDTWAAPALAHFSLTPAYVRRVRPSRTISQLRIFRAVVTGRL